MLDKYIKTNWHSYYIPNIKNSINIKYFSDIQHNEWFDNNKLYKISELLNKSQTDYVCIGGDIIDSTNHIRNNRENQILLLKWLENIASNYKTFINSGNHDLFYRTENGWDKDYFESFWKEVNEIENINISFFNQYYEDENILIYFPELEYGYYENDKKKEDISILINKLENDKNFRTNLNKNKTKVMLIHSPYLLDSINVLKLIKEFDIIISGHMHRGLMFPVINEIIKGNKGLVSPYGNLFPDNARGVKMLKYENKEIPLIISGGITKLSNGIGRHLNFIYPMEIEDIRILAKK